MAASACLFAVVRWRLPLHAAPQPEWDPFEYTDTGFDEWGATARYYDRILDAVARGEEVPKKHLANFLKMSRPRARALLGGRDPSDFEIAWIARRHTAALRRGKPVAPQGGP